jgi:phosphopantothenoylcysteine decarboxylase/phosphopantothenate--cysteine ligase
MFDAPPEFDPVHVSLAEWADAVVVAPATANVIGKVACGIADDLLTCTVMATKAPVLIAPAMQSAMWRSAAVRANVAALKRRGFRIVGPDEGYLACGAEGIGRLTDTAQILESLERLV